MKNFISIFAATLFAVSGAFAEQNLFEQCPFAASKFKAIKETIVHDRAESYLSYKLRVLAEAHQEFMKKCVEEAEQNERKAMGEELIAAGANPEAVEKWLKDPKSVSFSVQK